MGDERRTSILPPPKGSPQSRRVDVIVDTNQGKAIHFTPIEYDPDDIRKVAREMRERGESVPDWMVDRLIHMLDRGNKGVGAQKTALRNLTWLQAVHDVQEWLGLSQAKASRFVHVNACVDMDIDDFERTLRRTKKMLREGGAQKK